MEGTTMVMTAEIRKDRARAKRLTKLIDDALGAHAQEREALWVKLREAGVPIATIAADSDVQDQAVRRVLRRAGAM